MSTKPKTKTEKFLTMLESGKQYTAAQIYARTGLENLSSTVHRLRESGYPIEVVEGVLSNGQRVFKYSI